MKRLLLIFLSLVLCEGIYAQNSYWEITPGPYGGAVQFIATHSNLQYAYGKSGYKPYYRSTDYGASWEPFQIQPAEPGAQQTQICIGRSGNFYSLIHIFTNNGWFWKLYYSPDEGATWQLRNEQANVRYIWEKSPGLLIGINENSHIYRSLDGGVTWQFAGNPGVLLYNSSEPADIVWGENGKIMMFSKTKMVYSLDEGASWAVAGDWYLGASDALGITPAGTIFRLHGGDSNTQPEIFRSTDWGNEWIPVNLYFAIHEFPRSLMSLESGRLLLSTSKRLFVSEDDGISWTVLPASTERAEQLLTAAPLPNGDVIGTYKETLFRSSDEGAIWKFSASGIQLAETWQLAWPNDSTEWALTKNGMWQSKNQGESWTRLLADTTQVLGSVYTYAPHLIAIVNTDSFAVSMGRHAWRTTNGGQSFLKITPPGELRNGFIFVNKKGYLFGSGDQGIIRSTDFGSTWQTVIPEERLFRLTEHPDGTLFVLAGSGTGEISQQLYRSTDDGNTWQPIDIQFLPAGAPKFFDMEIDAQGHLYISASGSPSVRIMRSNDLGETWTFNPIPGVFTQTSIALNSFQHVFAPAGGNLDVYCSVDDGISWYFLPSILSTTFPVRELVVSPSGHLYALSQYDGPLYRTRQSTLGGGLIRGQVLLDADADCTTPDTQQPIPNWIVEVSGAQHAVITTSESGQYAISVPPGWYDVRGRLPQYLWWNQCDSLLTVRVDSAQITDSVNFAALPLADCPLMSVDLGIPILRRCFTNTAYVSYCNLGMEVAENAWIDVTLDPFLEMADAPIAYESLGNNTYRFHVGDVGWGNCGQFTFNVYVQCDATVLGQTHCITAHGFPDTLCTAVPDWSGANIEAQASCQDSVVRLELRNTTNIPSATLDYIIIEDDVVLLHEQKQYDANESIQVEYPANGHTWRIESEQEPGHPFSNLALAFVEGCGGYQSLGYVNQFSVNGWTPSVNRACVENTGAYDPNDKRGFPTGYGDENRIRPGEELEYLIRFQNTGTDTAFTVEIRDTLSAWLDPASVRPGASSHGYTWHLSGNGILTFRFDNIMLPDSNVNLAGSQGFVSFRIDQKPEVPLETQILNSAAIYFDFNDPVITNQTLHTVGVDYLNATYETVASKWPPIEIQPNPAAHETLLRLPQGTEKVMLFDVLGRVKRTFPVQNLQMRLDRNSAPAGMYWLQATDRKGKITGVGKLVWM